MESATVSLITPEIEPQDFWAGARAEKAIWLPFASPSAPIQLMAIGSFFTQRAERELKK